MESAVQQVTPRGVRRKINLTSTENETNSTYDSFFLSEMASPCTINGCVLFSFVTFWISFGACFGLFGGANASIGLNPTTIAYSFFGGSAAGALVALVILISIASYRHRHEWFYHSKEMERRIKNKNTTRYESQPQNQSPLVSKVSDGKMFNSAIPIDEDYFIV